MIANSLIIWLPLSRRIPRIKRRGAGGWGERLQNLLIFYYASTRPNNQPSICRTGAYLHHARKAVSGGGGVQ